ncbi:thiamine phosphate synthase [Marinobacterium lutimaris]|uniref:Thiamine-phosphate synthase n=1 Tax=Marinobacterium lutimaris TaxID=568106 RepID=A0A1H6D5P4_9GAMM|nr:thiamine phosphate synthase [Marinobacterium lutimaris]SEG80308.1 thiamine-phosphate diphosphorylase [Marinobacterium lutimaris]
MNAVKPGLYGITDSTLMPDDRTLLDAVEKSLRGGASLIQYRDKSDDSDKRLRQARALNQLCQQYQVPLLINDDAQLAFDSGASGVHLGQTDGSLQQARDLLGPDAIIGITCHDQLDLALQAREGGADYVAFGAFFASKTKPNAQPAPLTLLQQARQQLDCPIVAIGGLSVDNASQVISAGADLVAVVHALFAADDIETRAQAFSRLFAR